MSSAFVYQPHVRTADGVLSPDLVIDRLLLRHPGADPVALPVNLLDSPAAMQQIGVSACASAALVLVAAGRGALVTVGSAHWDPALDGPASLAYAVAAKPVSREAVRLADCGGLAGWQLRTKRLTPAGPETLAATPVAALEAAAAEIAYWSDDAGVQPGTMLFICSGHRDAGAEPADGYAVTLSDAQGRHELALAYGVIRL